MDRWTLPEAGGRRPHPTLSKNSQKKSQTPPRPTPQYRKPTEPSTCWHHFGITLGSIWDHFGVCLESLWGLFGITLGSIWDRVGLNLESL